MLSCSDRASSCSSCASPSALTKAAVRRRSHRSAFAGSAARGALACSQATTAARRRSIAECMPELGIREAAFAARPAALRAREEVEGSARRRWFAIISEDSLVPMSPLRPSSARSSSTPPPTRPPAQRHDAGVAPRRACWLPAPKRERGRLKRLFKAERPKRPAPRAEHALRTAPDASGSAVSAPPEGVRRARHRPAGCVQNNPSTRMMMMRRCLRPLGCGAPRFDGADLAACPGALQPPHCFSVCPCVCVPPGRAAAGSEQAGCGWRRWPCPSRELTV